MARVTLSDLVKRSTSTPSRKPRKLSAYQKADSAIWKEHNESRARLDTDYFTGRISKRKYETQKKLLGEQVMAKRNANIAKHNRDSNGNPKRTWGSPAQRAALKKAQEASARKRRKKG